MIQGLVALLLASIIAGTGFLIGTWYTHSRQIPTYQAEIEQRNDAIHELDSALKDVINKASASAIDTARNLDQIQEAFRERSIGLELLASRARELTNEFDKIQPTGCVYTPEYQRLLDESADTANTGRDRLYRRTNNPAH